MLDVTCISSKKWGERCVTSQKTAAEETKNVQDCFCPRSSTCLPNTELRMAEVELLVKLRINKNSFGLAAEACWRLTRKWCSVFCYKLFTSMVRVCHKLAWINEVYIRSNLGLRMVNQKPPAPQTISFHRTPQREKHKHRTPKGLRSPQHHSKRTSTPQHRKSPCPPP